MHERVSLVALHDYWRAGSHGPAEPEVAASLLQILWAWAKL